MSALEAEIKACIFMWQVLGGLGNDKCSVLCVDSKNVVDMYVKANAGLEDSSHLFGK